MSLPLGKTNDLRGQLRGSKQQRIPTYAYYQKLTEVEFVISPAGDRADCHRHLEAIGLGARPICNCPAHFRHLFGDLMVFSDVEHMNTLERHPELLDKLALRPITSHDQDILSTGFWSRRIQEEIDKYPGQLD